jgi:DNA polymerase IV
LADQEDQTRKIIHVDMDMFYAAIEVRDNPRLRGRPIAVGGKRGVVLTASYEARKFGVGSGLPGFQAAEKCPGLIFVHPRHEAYAEASAKTRDIFYRYSDIIAPRSLDEAYIDVTDNKQGLLATEIAQRIQQEVFEEVGITCSAGVSSNMMLAKIASDFKKPNGLTVVTPCKIEEFMRPLPLKKIPGIGPATDAKLERLGLRNCEDIWNLSEIQLAHKLGARFAAWVTRKSKGLDDSDVGYCGERKTYGAQRTIGARFHPIPELEERLHKIAEGLSKRMDKGNHKGKTVTLKVRFGDLRNITRSKTLKEPVSSSEIFGNLACELLKNTPADIERVRLVGIGISNLVEAS